MRGTREQKKQTTHALAKPEMSPLKMLQAGPVLLVCPAKMIKIAFVGMLIVIADVDKTSYSIIFDVDCGGKKNCASLKWLASK